jgi:hypothetical protein
MNLQMKRLTLSACVAVAVVPGVCVADDAKVTVVRAPAALSDMKVARDKETGQLRALTDSERAELNASGRSIAPNVVVLQRPTTTVEFRSNGSVVAKRSLDDIDNLVMSRTADGKVVMRHGNEPAPMAPTK